MTLETESVLDRRRLKRNISLWRWLAIGGVLIAAAVGFSNPKASGFIGQPQIARIAVEGTITENRKQLQLLKTLGEAKNVTAVLVFVNSPGGTTAGGEALFEALRELAKKKPVVAQFGTVAASAGYIVGLGADYIVARGNTITGSIGVIVQWPEVSGLLDNIGIKVQEVKSGDLKAVPSPFAPLGEKGRRITEEMVAESFRWFLSLVENRRGIKPLDVPGLADGRVFSGREALAFKLVDEIGAEAEAVRWLVKERQVAEGTEVVDWSSDDTDWSSLQGMSGWISFLTGGPDGAFAKFFGEKSVFGTLGLDGMVSIWQPYKN